jgi:hypothetical protein
VYTPPDHLVLHQEHIFVKAGILDPGYWCGPSAPVRNCQYAAGKGRVERKPLGGQQRRTTDKHGIDGYPVKDDRFGNLDSVKISR